MQVCFLGLEDPLKKEMTTHSSILPSVKWLPDQTDNLAYYPGLQETGCFPSGSLAKNPPAKQETRVQSLGWEDPLEKEMAALSNILAWEISWTEEPGGLQSVGSQKSWT